MPDVFQILGTKAQDMIDIHKASGNVAFYKRFQVVDVIREKCKWILCEWPWWRWRQWMQHRVKSKMTVMRICSSNSNKCSSTYNNKPLWWYLVGQEKVMEKEGERKKWFNRCICYKHFPILFWKITLQQNAGAEINGSNLNPLAIVDVKAFDFDAFEHFFWVS